MLRYRKSITVLTARAVCLICYALVGTLGQMIGYGQEKAEQALLDPTGHYTFTGQRLPPMRDFKSINLIAAGRRRDRISGDVTVGRAQRAPLVFNLIPTRMTEGRLTFDTQSINRISYHFEGQITKRRLPESEGGYDVPLLEGTLMKYSGGRKLGEIKGAFVYEEFAD